MKTIVLISCGNKKKKSPSKACEMYTGSLFVNSLKYAQNLKPDSIYILSAEYKLIELDEIINPYNTTLSYIPKSKRKSDLKILTKEEKRLWGIDVLDKLSNVSDLSNDKFVILASKEYIEPILSGFKSNLICPLDNMNLFARQKFLKTN